MPAFRPKEVLRQALESEKSGQKREAASQYAQVAAVLFRKDNFTESRTLYQRSIELQPNSPRLYVHLALCSIKLNDEESCFSAIHKFIKLTVAKNKAEKYRSFFEENLKHYPRLRQPFYEALLNLDRTSAAPFIALGECLLAQGNEEAARISAMDAFKTKTDDEGALALIKKTCADEKSSEQRRWIERFQTGKIPRAQFIALLTPGERSADGPGEKTLQDLIKDLEFELGSNAGEDRDGVKPLVKEFRSRAEEILEKHTKSRVDIALAFFEMGLVEDAIDELNKIHNTDSCFYEAQCLLGEIFFNEGTYMSAIEAFQKCLRDTKAPEEIRREANYKLAQVYMRLGDMDKAREILLLLEEKYPDYRQVRKLRSQLG